MVSISIACFLRKGPKPASCWVSTARACSSLRSLMETGPRCWGSPGGIQKRFPLTYVPVWLLRETNVANPYASLSHKCLPVVPKKKKICLQNTSDGIKHLFQTDSNKTCQYLLQLCSDQHKFHQQMKARQNNQETQELGRSNLTCLTRRGFMCR